MRKALINSLRNKAKDVVVVSDFHRLGRNAKDLRATLNAILDRGGSVVEARTGRSSEKARELAEMIFEANQFHAQRGLTSAQARKMGKLGAAASPATKAKRGRMPKHDAQVIWRDASLTVPMALAKINADRRFKEKYSKAGAYRDLGPRGVLAGRRPKQIN